MKNIVLKIILPLSVLFFTQSLDAKTPKRVVVLHTNDTHSHIDPQRGSEDAGQMGVIERAAFVDSVRRADGCKNVLYLDAGDFDQGSSYFTILKGDLEARLLRSMGVDAVALGNHEFDNGVDELARRMRIYGGDVLCANYDFSDNALRDIVKPYAIYKRGGFKIGVIGVLADVASVVDVNIAKDLHYQDPVEPVTKWAKYLRDEKKCDLVLVLSHLGLDGDLYLARNSRGLDAIVGGHSHTNLPQPVISVDLDGKSVTVVTDYRWGACVGQLEIKL